MTVVRRSLRGALFACAMLAVFPAFARMPDPDHPGPHHAWFEAQKVPDGSGRSCCAEADGHILEEEDWRIADGEYQVRIHGSWITFPNTGQGHEGNTILGETGNPMGKPVAWWLGGTLQDGVAEPVVPRCLAPGTVA